MSLSPVLLPHREQIKISPYPEGKSFGFTIIDDTDGCRLEMIRPIYDYLTKIGLKTTKTVWVKRPKAQSLGIWDEGDTLERDDYVVYLKSLQERAFEIALHNVSSQSNEREEIISGLEKFKEIFGEYPKINVHHEKNKENLYFKFAQSLDLIPTPFRSSFFMKIHSLSRKLRKFSGNKSHSGKERYIEFLGEAKDSNYFWGDICKERIKYIRSNIFYHDLNTLKCNPEIPYSALQTPYVNYWFDSSNGQDVNMFNKILNPRNIYLLIKGKGCCILYTHFGKGFSIVKDGRITLNEEAKHRLAEIAGRADGWYVPVSEMLDRLLSFKRLKFRLLSGGLILKNENPFDITGLTLWTQPHEKYHQLGGQEFESDSRGRVVIPLIKGLEIFILLREDGLREMEKVFWWDQGAPGWFLDIDKLTEKISRKIHLC
jgi:hypothetical protein